MEASQTFKDKRSRLTKEQRERVTPELVEEIMEKHVSPEHWPSFRRRHKAEFRKIAEGYVSQCMTFSAKDTKRPYKARIKGLLVSEVNGKECRAEIGHSESYADQERSGCDQYIRRAD